MRQKAENSRFVQQCQHTHRIANELNQERMACVERVNKVQDALGVQTDNMEAYRQPLQTTTGLHPKQQ